MADDFRVVTEDPFKDELFAPLDTRGSSTLTEGLSQVAEENPELAEGLEEEIVEAQPQAQPQDGQPEVLEYQDGSSITIENSSKGWKATLDTGIEGSGVEVFYGKSKDEMWQNVAAGKINATRKIRELNKKVKLGVTETVEEPEVRPTAQPRQLTADDIFEIKTKLESDPSLAMDLYFQKKTGMSVEDLVRLAQEGRQAKDELTAESVARAFVSSNPDYYPDPNNENYTAIVGYLAKHKLNKALVSTVISNGRVVKPGNEEQLMDSLVQKGYWTVENLTEAFNDLSESGLLVMGPEAPEEVAPAPVAPAKVTPTPQDERIVRTVRRPRAGLGIRQAATEVVRTPDADRPPSVEELDNLSDDAISQLFTGVRRQRINTVRR